MKRMSLIVQSSMKEKLASMGGIQSPMHDDDQVDSLDALRQALKRSSTQRNGKSVQALYNFVQHIKFFEEVRCQLSEDAVIQCCSHMTYESCQQGQVTFTQFVFRQGEIGAKFYIILEGDCAVMMKIEDEVQEITRLGKGDSFGELGLINNKPRSASILCRQDSHFAVLSKTDYSRILSKTFEQRLNRKVNFLLSLPFFKHSPHYAMQKLSYYFKEQIFQRKHVLAKAGTAVTHLLFVKEGEIQLLKELKIDYTKTKGGMSPRSLFSQVEIALLRTGECIGFEEANEMKPHQYTAVCSSSTAIVLLISTDVSATQDFFNRASTEESLKQAQVIMKSKQATYQERIQTMQMIINQESGTPRKSTMNDEKKEQADAESELKRVKAIDYRGNFVVPGKKDQLRSLVPFTLYPRQTKAVHQSSASLTQFPFRKLKSWDLIFARKAHKVTGPLTSREKVVNIHTQSQRQKHWLSLGELTFSFPQPNSTMTNRTESDACCLAINECEMVTTRSSWKEPVGKWPKFGKITRSYHSQFRIKHFGESRLDTHCANQVS